MNIIDWKEKSVSCKIKDFETNNQINLYYQDGRIMDGGRVIKNDKNPVYAYVYKNDESSESNFIGRLNITGPCPNNIYDIYEYVNEINDGKQSKFTNDIKQKIVIFMNKSIINSHNVFSNKWEMIQGLWCIMHQ